MERANGSGSPLDSVGTAVQDFVDKYGSVESFVAHREVTSFAQAFHDSSLASPHTVRGTGLDHSSNERANDSHFDSHDFLITATRLVEIGIVHPERAVSLPYLKIDDDKKLSIQAEVFMGKAPESKTHVIPEQVRHGAAGMRKMVAMIMQDKTNKKLFPITLDVLKVIHLFQMAAVHKSVSPEEAVRSIHHYDQVMYLLDQLEVNGTESLVRSIYQRLFDKPQTKALIQKLGIDIGTAADLRNWVETDGFMDLDMAPIAGKIKANIQREVEHHTQNLKKELLEYVGVLKQVHEKMKAEPAVVTSRIENIGGPMSERILRAAKMNPVITDIRAYAPTLMAVVAPETAVDASPVSEAPATLATPPPVFDASTEVIEPIVPSRTIFVGRAVEEVVGAADDAADGEPPESEPVASADAEEVLASILTGIEYFQNIEGRRPDVKVGFAHRFEFSNYLSASDFEIGDIRWENLNETKLADLFDSNSVPGINGFLYFFRTLQRLREEVRSKGLLDDPYVKDHCSKIFNQLFTNHE
jgi:hypothetical protein